MLFVAMQINDETMKAKMQLMLLWKQSLLDY